MTVIALVGNISEGFKAVGPFADFDEAAEKLDSVECWLMTLTPFVEPLVKCTLCGENFEENSLEYIGQEGDKPRPYCKACEQINE